MTDSPTPHPKLTPKQQLFVQFYLGDSHFNASDAALKAGYSVRQSAGDVLSNPVVRQRIADGLAARAASQEEVLAMLAEDARRTDGSIAAVSDLAGSVPAGAAFVSSLISARTSARQTLAKAHGLLSDKLHVTGDMVVRQYVNLDPDDFDAPADDDGGGL